MVGQLFAACNAASVWEWVRRGRYRRRPLQCRPEEVLLQAGLEAPSVAAFLHENLPDFLAGDGIDSAAAVYSYLTTSGMPCVDRLPGCSCEEQVSITGLRFKHVYTCVCSRAALTLDM